MFNLLRLFGMAVTFIVVVLLAALQQPELADDLALDNWNGSMLQSRFFPESKRSEEVDALSKDVTQRVRKKERVVQDLLCNRCTLFEAAAIFRHLDETAAKTVARSSDLPDEEFFCQEVIHWVVAKLLYDSPDTVEGAVHRLEEEVRRNKERYGTVILPNVV